MRKCTVLFLVLSLGFLFSAAAETETSTEMIVDFAWYPANLEGYGITGFAPIDYDTVAAEDLTHSDDGRDLGGQGLEARVTGLYSLKSPWLQGIGPLTSGNNLLLQLKGEISPVSVGAAVRTVLTPLALMNFEASLYAGSGWSIGELNGLALNTQADPFEATPLGGVYIDFQTGGTLQFDVAAVAPGDWNHLVMVYRPMLSYKLNSAAAEDEPWQWQADGGENYNGWYWSQTAVLGYQTPALDVLNTAGFLFETEQRITRKDDATMDAGGWGSDFMQIYLAAICVLDFGESQSLTIQAQFANGRKYSDDTIGNESFLLRDVDTADPTYWYFRRIALSYSLDF